MQVTVTDASLKTATTTMSLVVPAATTSTAMAVGYSSGCAITSAGGVECWGSNLNGQLGNGTVITSKTPVPVSGLSSGVTSVVVGGSYFACALTSAGGVKCWGAGSYGQLGNGSTGMSSTPVDVSGLTSGVKAISAGSNHACAVTTAGAVKCWGYNYHSQLGDGDDHQLLGAGSHSESHQRCDGGRRGGGAHLRHRQWWREVLGLRQQVGAGSTGNYTYAADVNGLTSGVTALDAGASSSCAVVSGGVKCWGVNTYGQLGDGTTNTSIYPVSVSGLSASSGATGVAVGDMHACALVNGGVKCWGSGTAGRLGNGSTSSSSVPVDVTGMSSGITSITARSGSTCAMTSGGFIKCWGDNGEGQLGNGGGNSQPALHTVTGLTGGVASVSAGQTFTCVVNSSGGVSCWGKSDALGDGTTTSSFTPVAVSGLASGVSSVAAGNSFACVRTTAGAAKCWGNGYYGQLGNGANVTSQTPANVTV